ncbi:hypothetical protein, partial [Burkholderia ubonensis]|uniref:hypothetical protein n=1 Tax=Burkholderia ubonensis TaxID=101571 RepID=UPI001E47E442
PVRVPQSPTKVRQISVKALARIHQPLLSIRTLTSSHPFLFCDTVRCCTNRASAQIGCHLSVNYLTLGRREKLPYSEQGKQDDKSDYCANLQSDPALNVSFP